MILDLEIEDQLPVVPARFKIAKTNEEDLWRYLVAFDPLFTRELPPTEKAIQLYARYITKYLESTGLTGVAVTGNVLGTNEKPTGVEFVTVRLRTLGH